MMSAFEPLKPHWMDDKSGLETADREEREKMDEIFDKVKFEDKMRDHSID